MEKLVMDRVSCHVTAKCNLRCKKCAVYIPKIYELGNAPEYCINEIKSSFDTYFKIVESVRLISLTGGETLLYPNLSELIEFILAYEKKFSKLEVFTNGTLSIPEPVLAALSKSEKVCLFVDNYGPHLSKKLDEIEWICKERSVNYTIRKYHGEDAHMGGWVDRGILPDKLSEETAKMHFSKCVVAKKGGRLFTIFGRLLVFCATPYCGYRIGALPESDVICVDLGDQNMTLEEKHRKLAEMDNMDYNPGCAWCNGLGVYDNVERFVPGEQIMDGQGKNNG